MSGGSTYYFSELYGCFATFSLHMAGLLHEATPNNCACVREAFSVHISAVILLLESTLIIGGRIIADDLIIGQNLWRHNICM